MYQYCELNNAVLEARQNPNPVDAFVAYNCIENKSPLSTVLAEKQLIIQKYDYKEPSLPSQSKSYAFIFNGVIKFSILSLY